MKLLLSSSGHTVVEFLLQEERFTGQSLAYVTTASFGTYLNGDQLNTDYIVREKKRFEDNEIKYDEIHLEDYQTTSLAEVFLNYKYVYVTGGNTYYLLKKIRESGFDSIIGNLLNSGVVYLGSSAGSYVTGPNIAPATWSVPERHYRYGVTDLTAMNLVPFLVKAHYIGEKREAILKGLHSTQYKTYVLNDNQAVLFDNGKISIFGEQPLIDLLP